VREERARGEVAGVPKRCGVPESDTDMGTWEEEELDKMLKTKGEKRLERENKKAIDLHKEGRGSRSYTIRTNWYVGRKGPIYWKERVVPTCL